MLSERRRTSPGQFARVPWHSTTMICCAQSGFKAMPAMPRPLIPMWCMTGALFICRINQSVTLAACPITIVHCRVERCCVFES